MNLFIKCKFRYNFRDINQSIGKICICSKEKSLDNSVIYRSLLQKECRSSGKCQIFRHFCAELVDTWQKSDELFALNLFFLLYLQTKA